MKINNLITYLFFIFPLTNKLYVGSISVSMLILLFALFLIVLNPKKRPLSIDSRLLFVTLLVFCHSILFFLIYKNATILNLLIVTSFSLILTLIYPSQLEAEYFYKVYKKVAILPLIGLIYHLIVIFVLGRTVNPLTFFPSLVGHTATDMDRPMSFFSEPAHLASYFLPLFILSLYKKEWKWAAISMFSIIMSFSFLGLVTSAIITVFFLLTNSEIKHRVLYIIIAVFVVSYLSSLPIFSYFFERGDRIASESDASSMVRIVYGFELIKAMDINTLLWGIGAGNNLMFFHEDEMFYNSLAGVIIDYGIILATIIYFIFFVTYSYKQSQMILAFQVCTLALLAGSTLYFSLAFFFQYTFYYVFSGEKGHQQIIYNSKIKHLDYDSNAS